MELSESSEGRSRADMSKTKMGKATPAPGWEWLNDHWAFSPVGRILVHACGGGESSTTSRTYKKQETFICKRCGAMLPEFLQIIARVAMSTPQDPAQIEGYWSWRGTDDLGQVKLCDPLDEA